MDVVGRDTAEALAEAVQASASASVSARASALLEVSQLRAEIGELKELMVREAEQRVQGLALVRREVELVREEWERRHGEAHGTLREEGQIVNRKHGELADICVTLQARDQGERPWASDLALWEQRVSALNERCDAFGQAHRDHLQRADQLRLRVEELNCEHGRGLELHDSHRKGLDDIEVCIKDLRNAHDSRSEEIDLRIGELHDSHRKGLEELEVRVMELAGSHGKHKEALELRVREIGDAHSQRHDELHLRIEEMKRIHGQAHSDALAHVEQRFGALGARLDSLAQRGSQFDTRVEIDPHASGRLETLASRVDALTMDLANKADRDSHLGHSPMDSVVARVDQLASLHKGEISRIEAALHERVGEAMKVGQQAHEVIRIHVEERQRRDRSHDSLAVRVDALAEGLAAEARIREEAVLRVEGLCRQAREGTAATVATTAGSPVATAGGRDPELGGLERQLKAVLQEVRFDAERAETGRREEASRRQEAELALMRLRGELDSLREEITIREQFAPRQVTTVANAPTVVTAVPQICQATVAQPAQVLNRIEVPVVEQRMRRRSVTPAGQSPSLAKAAV